MCAQIAEARATDAGAYTCEVDSSGGGDTRSANLFVIELPYTPSSISAQRVSTQHKGNNTKSYCFLKNPFLLDFIPLLWQYFVNLN